MKKIFLYTSLISLLTLSCNTDETTTIVEPETLELQNSYDDQAIQKFLTENYFDALGNIKAYSSTTTDDDLYPSLASLEKTTLPSGVIFIKRIGAQPATGTGTAIGSNDIIHIMHKTFTYVAVNNENVIGFTSAAIFRNTIDGTGVPEVDPSYYFVKKKDIDVAKGRKFYEIEGLKEALPYFTAFNKSNDENYAMQGVIIVPSRAAFARDDSYNYTGYSMRNRTLVFNFQIYKSSERPVEQ